MAGESPVHDRLPVLVLALILGVGLIPGVAGPTASLAGIDPPGAVGSSRSPGPGAQIGDLGTSAQGRALLPENPGLAVGTFPYDRAQVHRHTYPVFDPGWNRIATQEWRVVHGTGNCCENYLAATPSGRLLDFGGRSLRFSDDLGQTWRSVGQFTIPLGLTGEGAVIAAPNGDILGLGWAPFTGDRVWAHKYDASEDQWYFSPVQVRQPFYDRPYIYVVPGPFELPGGDTAPYLSLIEGKGWMSASFDGLTYVRPSTIHTPLPSVLDPGKIRTSADTMFDWIQPQQGIGPEAAAVTTLDHQLGYNAGEEIDSPCASARGQVLGPDLVWRCLPDAPPGQTVFAGSQGNLHSFSVDEDPPGDLVYRVSTDAGSSWAKETVALNASWDSIWAWDVKVNAASDVAAVALQIQHKDETSPVPFVETSAGREATIVYVFTGVTGSPALSEILKLGKGTGSQDARFDFPSLAILPQGRIATSFVGQGHETPAVAIQLS